MRIKNTTQATKTWCGQDVGTGEYYVIPPNDVAKFQSNDVVLADIGSGDAVMNDGVNDFGVADGIQYLMGKQPLDPDTGGIRASPKWAPDGWLQQRFEIECKTSTHGSIHEKKWTNVDHGWASLKFYDANDDDITFENQAYLTANCVRTDLEWMPNKNYAIKGGYLAQIISPLLDVYAWALGADIDPQYGIPPVVFLDGGLNLAYVDGKSSIGMDGVSATVLYYDHPQLGAGTGTNRLRFVFRHPAGFDHRIQMVLDVFMDPSS